MTKSEYISLSFFIGAVVSFCTALCFDYGTYRNLFIGFAGICFFCSISGVAFTQKKMNRVEKTILILLGVAMVIVNIIAFTVAMFIEGNMVEKIGFIIGLLFLGLLILYLKATYPELWLKSKLNLMYDNYINVYKGDKELNGKKIKFAGAKDNRLGISYEFFAKEKCLHIRRRIFFMNPTQYTDGCNTLVTQIRKRIEELKIPAQVLYHGCDDMFYVDIEVLIKKKYASKDTLCALKEILCELKDTDTHDYMLVAYENEVWYIEACGSLPVWAIVEVYDSEELTEDDMEVLATHRPNMILQHLYYDTNLNDITELSFMTKEEMIRFSSKCAEYVNKTNP